MIQVMETPATEQIEALAADMARAWNRHDMAAFAVGFAFDADFVNVIGMHWRGRAEIQAMHERLHQSIFRDSQIRQLDSSVRFLRSDFAVAHYSWEMTGSHGTENWKVPEVRRTTMSMVLAPSKTAPHGWEIAALHNTEVVNVTMSDVDGK